MNLAFKDIKAHWGKFLFTALGVGMLMLAARSMAGLYRGIVTDALVLIEDSGADLWVVQAGTEGPFSEGSRLDRNLVERVRGVQGVASARPFELSQKRFQVGARSVRGSLLGLDYPSDRGGWAPLVAGRGLAAQSGEALADAGMGWRLGDTVCIGRQSCRIVGLTRGLVDSGGNPVLAATLNDVLEMESFRPTESILLERAAGLPTRSAKQQSIAAVLVNLAPGADPTAVRKLLAGWGDVNVLSRADERDVLLLGRLDNLRRQILMFLVILLLVSTVVVSVTIYTMTLDKLHEIALLKLIGAGNRMIVGMILEQALLLGAVGFGFALAAGRILEPLFPRRLVMPLGDTLQFGLAALALCAAGSAMGIRRALTVRAQEVLS